MRRYLLLIIAAIVCFAGSAEIVKPVDWSTNVEIDGRAGKIMIHADVKSGWHLYAMNLPSGGPVPTTISLPEIEGITFVGPLTPSHAPIEKVDTIFNLYLGWWNESVTFVQDFKLAEGVSGVTFPINIRYQACNNKTCVPPTKLTLDVKIGDGSIQAAPSVAVDTVAGVNPVVSSNGKTTGLSNLWAPVTYPDNGRDNDVTNVSEWSWVYIFIWGFVGGLVALLTPCVWPMIPLTVSFFLKKGGNRSKAIADAAIYGGAIIVIYLLLGLAVTLLFGASKLNELSTNAVFNLAFFVLLVVFAISFFGAFDIKLPASWSTKMDNNAERTTGLISIFFMAFTLALVSFSCTGPLIGTLLVEAASQGEIAGPAIGMGAFALALAIPFTLFAIFPSMLKEMPRSGGWLNSVKVVLGFLELILSLKFLSIADLAYGWGILDREVFVALWIVLFVLLALYLLGKLRFSHDAPLEYVSIPRFFMALASLSFAVYLLPGMWGAPLKGVSAFVPPLFTQDFNLYDEGNIYKFDDYEKGMAYAAENHKPVLVDFSGYGCVNCRKMEGAVFDTPQVSEIIRDNYVLITLMVDDKTDLEKPVVVEENGRKVTLETVGDLWSYLQRVKFGANVQPFYVVLDNSGNAMESPYYYDENVQQFVDWLNSGIKEFDKK